ncbi:hypothetical protein Gotri_020532, partial [Gossypium trilobum]|nr:hypothetical protein [Gossypium trilobum]
MSSPTDWSHFYYQNLSNQEQVSFDEQGHDATVVATVTATSSGGHLSPEGRVGKPVPPAGFQLQYQQQQQQQLQLMQHQNQAYMFSRLGGNNPRLDMEHGSEPFVAEGGSSQVPPSRTGSSNENT